MKSSLFYAVCHICEGRLPIIIDKLTTGDELQSTIEKELANCGWTQTETHIMCVECENQIAKLLAKRSSRIAHDNERVDSLYPSDFIVQELVINAGQYLEKYLQGEIEHVDDIAPTLMQAMRWATTFQASLDDGEMTTVEMNRQAVTMVPQGLCALEFFGRWYSKSPPITPPPSLGMGAS